MMNNKNFFQLKNNYTGEKEFLLALRKLDRSPAKKFSDKISIFFFDTIEKKKKKRMRKKKEKDTT